jgi:hypothetical protein
MHSDKMRNKIYGNLCATIIINAVMAGIYGWFLVPSSNLDIWKVWETRIAEREAFDSNDDFSAAYPDAKDRFGFWTEGLCFYTPTTVDGIEN